MNWQKKPIINQVKNVLKHNFPPKYIKYRSATECEELAGNRDVTEAFKENRRRLSTFSLSLFFMSDFEAIARTKPFLGASSENNIFAKLGTRGFGASQ